MNDDLRTPLNEIIATAEGLLTDKNSLLNDQQQQDVQAIFKSAKRLLDLVGNVPNLDQNSEQIKSFSHETRVLLNNIIGFSSFWRNELPPIFGTLTAAQMDSMRKIHNNGIALFYLVNALIARYNPGDD